VHAKLVPLEVATELPRAGEPVLVVGSPLGLGGSVTSGVVSASERVLQNGQTYVQFSAPSTPGTSGGPVVDSHGQVVGVASSQAAQADAEGIGFAIPFSQVCSHLPVCSR